MQEATVSNTIAFVKQRQLLLKHDIPYFSFITKTLKKRDTYTKPATDKDFDNL